MALTEPHAALASQAAVAADNRRAAQAVLERLLTEVGVGRGASRHVGHLGAGGWRPSADGATFSTDPPAGGHRLANVASGAGADVHAAATAAAEAFASWRATGAKERRRMLYRLADRIEENAEQIALLEVLDTGQPLRFMRQAAARGAENFRFFADRIEGAADGMALPTPEFLNYTRRQPIGPVAVITPWNTPFMLSTWKIAPALAAGCTVVHKPAEWSPLTATGPMGCRRV